MALEATILVKPVYRGQGPAALADGAFEVYRGSLVALTSISVLTNLPFLAAVAGLLVFVRDRGLSWGSAGYFVPVALLSLAVGITAWLRAIGTGAMAHAALTALAGRKPSAGNALAAAFSLGAALGVVCALRLVMVLMGLVLCTLPGVLALLGFALAPHAVMLERIPASRALVRAAQIAPRAAGGLFAAACLTVFGYLLAFAQVLLFLRIAAVLGGLAFPVEGAALLARPETPWIALALAKILVDPLIAAATASAWVDGRIRTDGMDLELRAQSIAGERLAVDPEMA